MSDHILQPHMDLAIGNSVTTHAAARILGVAVTTVLNMVERGQLPAWRAPGGHRRIARGEFAGWGLPIDLRLCVDGVSAMLEIGRDPPDLLVTDLLMPEVDGFSVVRTLTGDTRYVGVDIVVISGLSDGEIAQAGGLPKGIVRWAKPIPFGLLRGYLDAKLSRMAKEAMP